MLQHVLVNSNCTLPQSLWRCHHDTFIVRVHQVRLINTKQRRASANLWTKPII